MRRSALLPSAPATLAALALVSSSAPASALDLGATLQGLLGILGGNTLEDVTEVTEGLVGPGGVIEAIEVEVNLQAAAIADLDVDIGDLRGSLTLVEGDVASLVSITGDHEIRIAALDDTVAGHGLTLATHTTEIAALQQVSLATTATLATHQTRLDDIDSRLNDGLATLGAGLSAVNGRVDRANEGVAMAMALKSPYVPADKTFALSGGWGTFEGEHAFGLAGAVRATEYLQLDGGVAFGAGHATVGGRLGATVAW